MLKIFQDNADHGQALMDRDQQLLDAARAGEQATVVRFYTWSEPTISLGFHQKTDLLQLDVMQEAGVPWVRRPTGGAAVLHSEELTYAIIVPDVLSPGFASKIHELVGRSIANGLRELGVKAQLDSRGEPMSALPNRESCFVRTSRWEVTVDGRKMVGSAQRMLGSALLQHGSILTGRDHLRIVEFLNMESEKAKEVLRGKLAVKSTSIEQELNRTIPENSVREAMERSFHEVFSSLPDIRKDMIEHEAV